MDFKFSEEQQMLQETTRRFIAKDYGFEARNQIKAKSEKGYSPEVWQSFADLGLLALNVPEENDGMGGTPIDTMLVMQAMGEGLVLEPYLASAVVATKAITALGNAEQRASMLPALASGEKIAVLAHDEPTTRFDWKAVGTTATADGDGYALSGLKNVVTHGASADILLVTARIGPSEEKGSMRVFAVPCAAAGVQQTPYKTVDGIPASEIRLDKVRVTADAVLGDSNAEARVRDVLDFGLAAICAEAVGALDRLLAQTVEYTRTRKQFGVPIGRFQALQHRMADMVLHIEQARSMSYLAAVRCTDPDPVARRRAMSAAKVVIGQACRFVGQNAVQLHGGMGVTDELDVSHYFKRLMAIELQFGSTDHHLEMFASQMT